MSTQATPIAQDEEGAGAGSRPAHLRATAKHGIIYSVGVVLSRLIGFIMIPIYTRVLQPEDYGVLEILSLTTDVVSMLAGFGIGLSVIRTLYRYDSDRERNLVGSSAMWLLLVGFAVIAAFGLVWAQQVANVLLGDVRPDTGAALVRLTVLGMAFGSMLEVPLAMLRARQNSTEVVAVGLARLVLSVSLNIVLVVWMRLGVAGVLWSTLLTSGLVGGFLTLRLMAAAGLRFSATVARQLVSFGAPLVVWNLASFVMHYSDRYFLRTYATFDDLGLYSLSYRLAMVLPLMIAGPFSEIWIPKSLEIERSEGTSAPELLTTILHYFNILLVTTALGIALFATDAIRVATGEAFHAAHEPVPLLVLGMVFFSYRAVGQLGALIKGRSDLIALASVLGAVAALILNFLMIPRYGNLGAAMATATAFGLEFLLMRHLSARVYKVVVPLRTLAHPLMLAVLVWTTAQLLVPLDWALWARLAALSAAVIVYAAALFATGALSAADRRTLLRATREPAWLVAQLRGR